MSQQKHVIKPREFHVDGETFYERAPVRRYMIQKQFYLLNELMQNLDLYTHAERVRLMQWYCAFTTTYCAFLLRC